MPSLERFGARPDPNIDGGWGWVVVLVAFTIRVIVDGYVYTFGIFYVELIQYFDTTRGAASLVMSILIGFKHFVGPVASGLVNKYGCRVVSFLGTGLICLGLLLSLAVPRVEYLYLTIGLISGTGCGLICLPTVVGVAVHFEKKRATAMGISLSGSGVAMLVFAPLLEWLIKYYHSWKGALLIVTGLVMNCFVLSFFYKTFTVVESRSVSIDKPSIIKGASAESIAKDLESKQPKMVSKSTQTPKEGEEIQGLYTITVRVRIETSTSAHLPGAMEKCDILCCRSSTTLYNITQQLQATPAFVSEAHNSSVTPRGRLISIFKDIVVQMVGTTLLKNYSFLIFSLGNFFTYFGLMVPCTYLYHKAIEMEIATSRQASWLLSVVGIANIVGKVVIGYWADQTSISTLSIYTCCLLIMGISTMMTSLITNYSLMVSYMILYGITWGGSVTLSSIVMVSLFGIDRLSNAYGLFLLCIGVSTTIGTPLTGVLHDFTNNYDTGFYLSGVAITLGSLLLFTIPTVRKKFPQQ